VCSSDLLEWTRVTAPVPGRIGLRQVDVGNLVRASDANGLASIAQTAPISVLFSVPEAHLSAIRARLKERRDIPVQAWDRERRQMLAKGRLLTTDNQIDVATGTLRLKAGFANKDDTLFPNQFVNARLLLDTRTDVLAVPAAAVQKGPKGMFVYTVDPAGVVAMTPVTPGTADGEWMEVEADLKPGARVVIDGVDKLREGAKVEVIVPGERKGGVKGPRGEKGGARPEGGPSPKAAEGARPSGEGPAKKWGDGEHRRPDGSGNRPKGERKPAD
jgi:multidrug efflux system membrane fusion protein